MIIDSPIISGSYAATGSLNQVGNVTITGSLTVTGPIIGALTGSVDSASFATTASYANNAATASSADNFTVRGTLTAQTIVAQTVTSSTVYSSGSNIFGNSLANTQTFTGSVNITGSLAVNGTSSIIGTGTSGQVAYFNGTSSLTSESNLFWDATNDRLGIGINSPLYTLHIRTATGGTNPWFTPMAVMQGSNATFYLQNTSAGGGFGSFGVGATSGNFILSHDATKNFVIQSTDGVTFNNRFNIIGSTGNVGINTTTDAGFRFDVSGSTRLNGNTTISGSLTVITGSGIEFQVTNTGVKIGNIITDTHTVTGSFSVSGSVTATDFTGSLLGTASNANLLDGLDSSVFTSTGSFNEFSSSILSYTSSTDIRLGSLETASGSAITRLGALEVASGSAISRLNALEVASGSAITRLSSLEVASGSATTRLNALEVASGSAISRLNAIELTTGSLNAASGSAITRLNSIENKTGSYATTGSNTFDGGAYFSSSFNPTGFTTTASLYTDGGLRVTKDAYISGTLYLNNVTVFGTQSVAYISSSQLNIGTNIITVNTDTPSVRFGGLAVYDSGSTGLTGSMLWDSQANHWIYSNPSGSSYSGGMFISGPRTAALGNEQGTTACMLLAGQGGDHLTSSMIYHSSTVTCFGTTSTIDSAGVYSGTCIIASSKIVVGGTSGDIGADLLRVKGTIITDNNAGYLGYSSAGSRFELAKISSGDEIVLGASNSPGAVALISGTGQDLILRSNGTCERIRITSAGNVGIGTNSPAERLSVAGAIISTCGITGHGANRTTLSQEGLNGAFWQSYGTDASTVGTFTLRQASSDFSVVRSPLVIASTGAATFSSTGVFGKANASAFKVLDVIADTTDGFNDPVNFESYGTAGANIILRFAKGTYATPTAVSVNNLMGSIGVRGYDGTTFSGGGRAGIYMYAAEDFTPTAQGTFLDISTTPIGAATRVERIRVHNDGNVVIGATCNSCFKLDVNGTGRFTSTLLVGGTTITDGHLVNIIGNQSSVNIGVVLNNTNATHSRIYGITNVNGQFSIYDYTAAAQRFFISSTGIACFACQVCAPAAMFAGCIGIGTSSPGTQLAIFDTNNSRAYQMSFGYETTETFRLGNNNVTGKFTFTQLGNSNGFRFNSSAPNAQGIIFDINTSQFVVNGDTGNVGIGTASPVDKLDVAGALRITGVLCANGIAANSTYIDQASGTARFLSYGPNSTTRGSINFFQASSTNALQNTALAIDSTGVACFSSTICAQGATFTTTGNTAVTIAAGATGLSRLIFQGTVGNARGFVDYDNSTCGFIIRTNESTALTISNVGAAVFSNALQVAGQQAASNYGGTGLNFDFTSGNVGRIASVKTTSGGSSLEVHTYNTSGADVTALTINSNGISCFACQVCVPQLISTGTIYAGPTSRIGFGTPGAERGVIALNAAYDWSLNTNSIACAVFICSANGNVGIGTATPLTQFHINDGVNVSNLTILTLSQLGNTNDRDVVNLKLSFNNGNTPGIMMSAIKNSSAGSDLTLSTGANSNGALCERMRITSTGIACFACQVCVGGMVALNNTSFGGPATEAAFRIRMADNGGINNDPGIGLDGAGSGSERMWFNALSGHYFNNGTNGIKLNIDSAGIACFACQVCVGGSIIPLNNGSQDLGSSSNRWCTVYTSDLSLNNGIGNYTIVEGENDLFLYNNNSCKVYKFIVQEVCSEIAPTKRST